MTHQPPVPDGNSSPYPLQPAPLTKAEKRKADAAIREREAEAEAAVAAVAAAGEGSRRPSNRAIGIGAAIGLGAAAAVSGLLYARRDTAAAKKAKPAKASAKPAARQAAKNTRGRNADRRRVAANQPYEVSYFARKHGLTAAEARAIIKEAGPSRDAANALAKKRSQ